MKLQKLNKSYSVLSNNDIVVGSFQLDSDGSYYFYHTDDIAGCWSAHSLKEIAELLDEVNKPFDKQVEDYFLNLQIKF